MVRPQSRRRVARFLRRGALITALLLSAILLASIWVIPWLGRRGNLNALVEGILTSSLKVPVQIESVVSEPFSELTVTKLRSVQARAEDRLHFKASSISVFYDPIELLSGRIRSVIFERPEVFLNLDAPLGEVARVPTLPPEATGPQDSESPLLLPFTVDSTIVDGASLRLRFEGRELPLSSLRVRIENLGKAEDQEVSLTVEAFGGRIRASGGLDVIREEGRPAKYRLRDLHASIEGMSLKALASWLAEYPGEGALDLEGSVNGTWPEEVRLSLSGTASGLSSATAGFPSVREGSVGLRVEGTVHGDLERVEFQLSTSGEGAVTAGSREIAERATLELAGEFRRLEEPGGVLELFPSKLALAGLGDVHARGKVRSLFGTAPPRLHLSVDLPALRLGEAFARVPLDPFPPSFREAARTASGRLALHLEIGGTPAAPLASGSFEVEGAGFPHPWPEGFPLEARGLFRDAEIDAATGVGHLRELEIEARGLPAGGVAGLAGLPDALLVTGEMDVAAALSDLSLPAGGSEARGTARIAWRKGGLDWPETFAGAAGVSLDIEVEGRLRPFERRLDLDLSAGIDLEEVLIGSFYGALRGKPLAADASATLVWDDAGDLSAARLGGFTARAPAVGPISASGAVWREAGGGIQMRGGCRLDAVPLGEAYRTLVRDWLGAATPFLVEGEARGWAVLDLEAEGPVRAPRIGARLGLGPATVALPGLRVEGLEVETPISIGSPAPPLPGATTAGVIRARRIEAGPAVFDGVRLPFRLAGGAYKLSSPARLDALGGSVELREAEIVPGGAEPGAGARGRLSARGSGLDLGPIARARGLKGARGRISFDFDPIVLAKGTGLDARGTLEIAAFGGAFTFTDFRVRNLAEPYASLRLGLGRIDGVRLARIGETFRFGLLSGVLRGEVKDLSFTGGEVTSFEVDVETVPIRGVPQFIDKRAIESIRRVLQGPFGAIEETLFSRFRFHRLGFWSRLRNGIFRLQGKYVIDGVEYLVYGRWYQFPRIDIINSRPRQPYDWRSILENIRQFGGKGDEKADEKAAKKK